MHLYTEAFCCTEMQYQLVKHLHLSMKTLLLYSIMAFAHTAVLIDLQCNKSKT